MGTDMLSLSRATQVLVTVPVLLIFHQAICRPDGAIYLGTSYHD